ncbi:hypothetical protein JJJ17_03325 [Paracoccus caeni]|uniref:Uncharacterized protein n=1 Tax=Paracoccus caeni TaxID=657651 RepID=A0A934VZ59_9RHOB|nr:hypothetical protein [Paracoccus caeni]MBK4214953.1 hypothetical protein [Paracoccus caeni]
MIGAGDWKRGWTQAAIASVLLHATAVAALVWEPDFSAPPPVQPATPITLEISSISPDPGMTAPPVLTSVTAPEMLTDPQPENGSGGGVEQSFGGVLTPVQPDEGLTISGNMVTAALPNIAAGHGETAPPSGPTVPLETPENAPPADPRVVELFDLIRDRLTEPCLLALPALLGEDQIQLGVMAADDRQISGLMREIADQVQTQVQEHAVLLDNRQCPALVFARRDPGYPVPGLSIQLETQDIASGSDLRGRISGGTGLYTTLLLIDDNGTVHDLRPFMIGSASGSRFSIPVARLGEARDTHQLILAIASPSRPDAVSRHAGELAEDFFAALPRDTGDRPRVGVASVYVR